MEVQIIKSYTVQYCVRKESFIESRSNKYKEQSSKVRQNYKLKKIILRIILILSLCIGSFLTNSSDQINILYTSCPHYYPAYSACTQKLLSSLAYWIQVCTSPATSTHAIWPCAQPCLATTSSLQTPVLPTPAW